MTRPDFRAKLRKRLWERYKNRQNSPFMDDALSFLMLKNYGGRKNQK